MKFFKKSFKLVIVPLIVCIIIAFLVTKYSSFQKVGKSIDKVIYKVIGTERKIENAIDKAGKALE
ncbi:MAG: hypothetical protein GY714_13850 [Desulfobacterales bacterium]|nr:hypothetical protein [Desulfobacterales bacterium]